ncbi:MAG TPA: hypothetical protein VM305_08620 [Candidatus Limnocylindrales bacterium]|nr:hypothetical protein [Candidatus Limnocylindrales bacterium]
MTRPVSLLVGAHRRRPTAEPVPDPSEVIDGDLSGSSLIEPAA